jgi:SAM-dependent methyltransferase
MHALSDKANIQIEIQELATGRRAVDEVVIESSALRPTTVEHLLALAKVYLVPGKTRILDFGCGPGTDARQLAMKGYYVCAVDSPLWFVAFPDKATVPGLKKIEQGPVELARQVLGDARLPEVSNMDVVIFRCSLYRVSQRRALLEAAAKLLAPGGVVVATDWVQTRTTDRATWTRLVNTLRCVGLETEQSYKELCRHAGLTNWRFLAAAATDDSVVEQEHVPLAGGRAMHAWFTQRAQRVRNVLLAENHDDPLPSYKRALLQRAMRDLDVLVAMSEPGGPLGWSWWAASKPE